jgi:hypothetical protein
MTISYDLASVLFSNNLPTICDPSVTDPGCLSRIPDPDFYPSRITDSGFRIPDPKPEAKERVEKKFVVIPFFVATNFT